MRQEQFLLCHVPDLNLTHATRLATGSRQLCSIGRKTNGFDSLGQTNQSANQFRPIRLMQKDFVVAGDRDQRTVR